jgi:hypothetical protein
METYVGSSSCTANSSDATLSSSSTHPAQAAPPPPDRSSAAPPKTSPPSTHAPPSVVAGVPRSSPKPPPAPVQRADVPVSRRSGATRAVAPSILPKITPTMMRLARSVVKSQIFTLAKEGAMTDDQARKQWSKSRMNR